MKNCSLQEMGNALLTEIYKQATRPTAVQVNPLKTKRGLLYLKTQFVPRSKHFSYRL